MARGGGSASSVAAIAMVLESFNWRLENDSTRRPSRAASSTHVGFGPEFIAQTPSKHFGLHQHFPTFLLESTSRATRRVRK